MICSECSSGQVAIAQCLEDDALLCRACADKGCPLCALRARIRKAIIDAGGDPDTAYVIRHEFGDMSSVADVVEEI